MKLNDLIYKVPSGRILLVASESAETWAHRFAGQDCCCSIVADLREALQDPHYTARGLFEHQMRGNDGQTIPALPMPIAEAFRGSPAEALAAPGLGAHTDEELDRGATQNRHRPK